MNDYIKREDAKNMMRKFREYYDEDKTNNFVENLEWCTHRDNLIHGTARKRAAKKLKGRERPESFKEVMRQKIKEYQNSERGNGRPVVCLETGVKYTSICDAASRLGISEGTIRQSCNRMTRKGRNGMTFRYCGAQMIGDKENDERI